MRALFILNPGSKGGASQRRFARIEALIRQHDIDAELAVTRTLEDARSLCIQGNDQGFDAIVAVGGDGTINNVLQGMFNADGTTRSQAKMGVVYTGTSPDFCKSYGIPLDLEAAVALVASGRSREVSVGRIEMAVPGEGQRVAFFGCCANIGLGAQLARRANSGIRARLGDALGTFVSLLQTIAKFHPAPVTLSIDGVPRELERAWNVSVGRTRHIASGLKVSHALRPDDDRFYVMIVQKMSLGRWPTVLRTAYTGAPIEPREFFALEHGSRVELSALAGAIEVELDGDPAGWLPARIATARDRLRLISEGDAC